MKIVPADERDDDSKRRHDDNLDWWTRAPRWLLRAFALVLIAALGYAAGQINAYQGREQARIDAALLDAPTKYQQRLSERVAEVEGRQAAQDKTEDRLSKQLDEQSKILGNLAVQVARLTAMIERGERNGKAQ